MSKYVLKTPQKLVLLNTAVLMNIGNHRDCGFISNIYGSAQMGFLCWEKWTHDFIHNQEAIYLINRHKLKSNCLQWSFTGKQATFNIRFYAQYVVCAVWYLILCFKGNTLLVNVGDSDSKCVSWTFCLALCIYVHLLVWSYSGSLVFLSYVLLLFRCPHVCLLARARKTRNLDW